MKTPESLNLASLAEVPSKAQSIKAEYASLCRTIAERIVADVERTANAQPKLS